MSFTLIPHLLPPKAGMLIPPARCWWRPEGAEVSHGEGDEAVVPLDVPLEDLGARSQHALKADPVQLHAFERTPGDDGGCPGPVQQQGDLTCGAGRGGGQVTEGYTVFQTALNQRVVIMALTLLSCGFILFSVILVSH